MAAKFTDTISRRSGQVIKGATARALIGGVPQPLYLDASLIVPAGTAVLTDANGLFEAYVADGTYEAEYSYKGEVIDLFNVELFDLSDIAGGIFPANVPHKGFWLDDPTGANLSRFGDRLFIGGASQIFGNEDDGINKTWVGNSAQGYMAYFDTRSQGASYSRIGSVAHVAASRSSDNDRAGELNTIGFAAYVNNDNANAADKRAVWSFYGHAVQTLANEFTAVFEGDTTNLSTEIDVNPFGMGVTGATALAWIGVGGETAQALRDNGNTTAQKTVSVALAVVNTCPEAAGNRFRKGIVFQSNALMDRGGGRSIFCEVPTGAELIWKHSGAADAVGGKIRSDNTTTSSQARVIFSSTGLQVRGVQSDLATETPLFRVDSPALTAGQSTNNVYVYNQPWTSGSGTAIVGVEGPATNADITLRGKGTGISGLQDSVGNNLFKAGGTNQLAFFGGALASQQTITGSRGGNAALTDLLAKLATYGLIVNGTSA